MNQQKQPAPMRLCCHQDSNLECHLVISNAKRKFEDSWPQRHHCIIWAIKNQTVTEHWCSSVTVEMIESQVLWVEHGRLMMLWRLTSIVSGIRRVNECSTIINEHPIATLRSLHNEFMFSIPRTLKSNHRWRERRWTAIHFARIITFMFKDRWKMWCWVQKSTLKMCAVDIWRNRSSSSTAGFSA